PVGHPKRLTRAMRKGSADLIETCSWVDSFGLQPHAPVPQSPLPGCPHTLDSVCLLRLDLAAYTLVASRGGSAHRPVLVWPGHPVRLGLLPLHALALASARKARLPGRQLLHAVADE